MKNVPIYLFLILSIGCTTKKTQVVTEYKTEYIKPPAAYLITCKQPFYRPPITWGDAAKRDPVWLRHFSLCAAQIENLRRCYQTPTQCAALPVTKGEL
ncbi:Rz1-like lysis system protein LysC [Photobacterium leiognathi]